MNSLKTLRLSTSAVIAALTVGGFATAAFAQTAGRLNASGTPDDGVVCRAGYTASFSATSMKCSKIDTPNLAVALICNDPQFSKYVVRAPAGGTPEGLDVCTKKRGEVGFVDITATSDIGTLVKQRDYVFAKANLAQIAAKTAARNQAEASALGVAVNEIETRGTDPVTNTTAGGSDDKSNVTLTFFSFPVRTAGAIAGSLVTTFVPQVLPR